MGYGTRNGGIKTFWPDDDENTIYIAGDSDLATLVSLSQNKWPGLSLSCISISSENIHTDCLTYDLHDGGDWTVFTVLRRTA